MHAVVDRFEILDFGPEIDALIKEREQRKKDWEKVRGKLSSYESRELRWKQIFEDKCPYCGRSSNIENEELLWFDTIDGEYMCYDCFIYGLQEMSSHMVPSSRAKDIDEYVDECDWNYYREEFIDDIQQFPFLTAIDFINYYYRYGKYWRYGK